jgi:general stress protein 13
MVQKYKVGDVVTGKVTGIQPYGAFVALDEMTQGLVHISEITYGYVKDVNEFIKVGDEITVKILEVDDSQKKISLSIRVLQETPNHRKREIMPRKTLQQRVDEEDADGFKMLQSKLAEWIKQQGQ